MRSSRSAAGITMLATITALVAMIALVAAFSASTGDLIGQARLDRARASKTNLRRSAELWARMHPAEARRGRQLDVSALDLEQAEVWTSPPRRAMMARSRHIFSRSKGANDHG